MYGWVTLNKLKPLLHLQNKTKTISVQFSCPVVSISLWPHGLQHARHPCPSPTPRVTQTHVHWVSDAIQPSHPLLPPSPPAFNLSQHQGLFQWVDTSHQMAKVVRVSASASVLPLNIQDFISLRMDWLDLLAIQGTLKSLLQHHSSKASILQHSAFFIVQFSHPYMTTEETIVLTIQTFVGKVMSLLLNTPSRFIIVFLPRSKCLLVSWLHSLSAWFWSPRK